MKKKMVFKSLPGGGYIKLRENFTDLDILAEVCSLEREKLDGLLEKQVISNLGFRHRHTRIPNDLVVESPPLQDKGDYCLIAAAAMMRCSLPTARRDDGVMLRKERSSSNKPPTLSTCSPDNVLSGVKRTRSLETSDKGISSDDNVNNVEKTLPVTKKKKEEERSHPAGPHPPPAMPAAFRNKILKLVGPGAVISAEKLLIQKRLTLSDVAKNQNRLSIPTKQLGEIVFLTADEERLLASHEGKNVGSLDDVTIIEPSLETSRVSFRMWEMRKGNGSSSTSFVITKTWNGIKQRHQLEEGMMVQVWAIRVDGKLWLAVVKLSD